MCRFLGYGEDTTTNKAVFYHFETNICLRGREVYSLAKVKHNFKKCFLHRYAIA